MTKLSTADQWEDLSTTHSHAGFFLMRAPLLSVDPLLSLSASMRLPHTLLGDADSLRLAAEQDSLTLNAWLHDRVSDPAFREAILLASPDFAEALGLWPTHGDCLPPRRVTLTLLRYATRASFRSTPFGLFAAWSRGVITDATNLSVGARPTLQRDVRADGGWLHSVLHRLAQDPQIRHQLRFFPNSSLYPAAGRLNLVVTRSYEREGSFELLALDRSIHLDHAIAAARDGATLGQIAGRLVNSEVSLVDAIAFVDELVESEVLLPELSVPVSGDDALSVTLKDLHALPELPPIVARLEHLVDCIAQLRTSPVGTDPPNYGVVVAAARAVAPEVRCRDVLQVDLQRREIATVPSQVVAELLKCASALRRISPRPDPLAGFAHSFTERYGQAWVPVAEVLDEDIGLGLAGIPDAAPLPARPPEVDRYLCDLLLEAARVGASEISLSDDDVSALSVAPTAPVAASFAILASIGAPSVDAIQNGDYELSWLAGSGPPGIALVARFAHADPQLAEQCQRFATREQELHPDAIVAEIVHLPSGRSGNVVSRPSLRKVELRYMGRSCSAGAGFDATDLLVGVEHGRVRLWSQQFGREVLPRNSTAHNFNSRLQLPVYRFLGLVQLHQSAAPYGWTWGRFHGQSHLPRIRIGRVVVAREQWCLEAADVRAWRNASLVDRLGLVRAWRRVRQVPRLMSVVSGENKLVIDLETEAGIDLLLHESRGREATIAELHPHHDHLVASGEGGRFVHELIIPVIARNPIVKPTRSKQGGRPGLAPPRKFVPGSEWSYVKLYTGAGLMDRVLCELVSPIVSTLRQHGATDRWFFVRYVDPEPHIRVRFRTIGGADRSDMLSLIADMVTPAVEGGLLWRLQWDTYEPETMRYGGPAGMAIAEELFWRDSTFVLSRLKTPSAHRTSPFRHCIAATFMASLFDAFGWDLDARFRWLLDRSADASPEERAAWSKDYRANKGLLASALCAPSSALAPTEAVALDGINDAISRLREFEHSGALDGPAEHLIGSLTHMHANRLYPIGAANPAERFIYDALRRYYSSIRHRHPEVAPV